ncbi:unnamed protein product [Paramecium primaurelia]|uniref:Uncharacterized protein n=1 Tax=Paramecium primaurelia TaxID=5886 RepID=A0A8S1KRE3_PARPR|nr:unnamed protein product [Paramecium primaurelia]
MQNIDKHINFLCSKIKGDEGVKYPKENIEYSSEAQLYFKEKFPIILSKMKFKLQKNQFQELTNDEDFLLSYMKLYKLDNSHQIFNNALQWFINHINNPEILSFVMDEISKEYQFNEDWAEETVPKLIEQIMKDYHVSDMIEIIVFILKNTNFNLELILKHITTSLKLAKPKKSYQKIDDMHPLLNLITKIVSVFSPSLEQVQQTYNLILAAYRHFFRDLLRNYVTQSQASAVGEFLISFSTQIPEKIDSIFCSTQLITLLVNEIANTISYLQYEKKLMSQQKLKLLDLVINLYNADRLYQINFYFNFYDIKQLPDGDCLLCQYKDQKMYQLIETETEKKEKLIECCKGCFCTQLQLSNNYEDQVYLPTITYGHACKSNNNWMKLYFENYLITQSLHNGKQNKKSKSISIQKLDEIAQSLEQMQIDYNRLQDIHMYLWYFSYMSILFQQLFQTYQNIELILLAFFEDNSIQVRAKVLHQFENYCLKVAKMQIPKNYQFSLFNTQNIIERIKLRAQDISKQIRAMIVQTLLKLWKECKITCLDIIINRMQDIEIFVRTKTIKYCLEFIDLFKELQSNDQIRFFEEVSKRLEEKGEIGEISAQLILLLLATDSKHRDQEIADKILELTIETNNYKIDYDRIQSLIDKLSDNNKIIDKQGILHSFILRLIQLSNSCIDVKETKQQINQIENVLKLIQIIINQKNHAQQQTFIKQIDNIMQITSYFLNKQEESLDTPFVNILNGLFKILVFCLEDLNSNGRRNYDKISFQLTKKLTNQLDYLIIFIEKIIYKIHPKTAFVKTIFTLSTLLDLRYTKKYENIYSKFEIVMKLILVKAEENPVSFQFGLIGFCQIFEYFEYFITKTTKDIESFLESMQTLYNSLLEFSKEKAAQEEIIFTLSKMWEKLPQLMFESSEFLKENLKENTFQEPIIIAIYQIFYESILEANNQAQKQQFSQIVDKSQLAFMIKDIFNVVFQQHILHPNKNIRVLVLKLIELLFDNQLSIALQFGDYLIVALMNDADIAEPILKKCIEVRPEHMLLQFPKGIKLMIQNYALLKPYFTGLDNLLKNYTISNNQVFSHSIHYDVCAQKFSDFLLYLDESYFLNKIDSRTYFNQAQFVLYQIIHLQYLSKQEIKLILKALLNRFDDFLSRIERKLQQLSVEKDYQIIKAILLKLFYAYQLVVKPEQIFGENNQTLRQIYQMKVMKRKSQKRLSKKMEKEILCFEICPKHINKFNQYVNSSEMNLQIQDSDLSDSEQDKRQSVGKENKYKQELELIDELLDFELGDSQNMFKLFDELGIFEEVEEKPENKLQEEVIEEPEEEVSQPKKSRRKTTKRRPRKY